ncbi:MAG: tRNA-dihydrouridine synthase [Pseudomonadota bacterium]
MRILLAPMEGVIDAPMRRLLTALGGYDACVTEFLRLSDGELPERIYHKHFPELAQGSRTAGGTPVILQLLGSDPELLAVSARRAAHLGATAIDLNFGCPSRFVNRKAGGAALLREPERIHDIVSAVRRALPGEIPVSAKMRLGYETPDRAVEIALGIEEAGADFLTVHARTREDGYRAPVRWQWLRPINDALTIPVIANGDINSVEDYRRCHEISGCTDIMLGRGALMQPDLARQIRAWQEGREIAAMQWPEIRPLLPRLLEHYAPGTRGLSARLKQWLGMLRHGHTGADKVFAQIRSLRELGHILEIIGRTDIPAHISGHPTGDEHACQ